MSRIRVPLGGLAAGLRVLEGEEAHYVRRVHRMRNGDTFVAFDPEHAQQAEARIVGVGKKSVQCELSEPIEAAPAFLSPTWLLLGLCKSDRFEWALREATALGVTEILPTHMARSSSAGIKADAKRLARWSRILVQGARQSGRGDVPRLHRPRSLRDALAVVPDGEMLRVCFWEAAREPVGKVLRGSAAQPGIAIMVGPEGGMEREEADLASEAGFRVVSMGSLILRTETAVIAALGAWRLLHEVP